MSRAHLSHPTARRSKSARAGTPLLVGLHAGLVIRLPARIRSWLEHSRQRRALAELAQEQDDHLLKDIGVSRDAARREAAKWFWS
jgi:uncharacterized protein YjiS (DUF1127 family)